MTVEAAKKALKLSVSDPTHDDELRRLINAATSQFQEDTDRAVISAQFIQYLHVFPPAGECIEIDVKPVQQIDSITYYDQDNTQQTIDSADYLFNAASRTIGLAPGATWPTSNSQHFGIEVTFTAGYGTADQVDDNIKSAIICLTAALFYGNSPDAEPYMNAYERLKDPKTRTSYV